jgi:hypothetical protein
MMQLAIPSRSISAALRLLSELGYFRSKIIQNRFSRVCRSLLEKQDTHVAVQSHRCLPL